MVLLLCRFFPLFLTLVSISGIQGIEMNDIGVPHPSTNLRKGQRARPTTQSKNQVELGVDIPVTRDGGDKKKNAQRAMNEADNEQDPVQRVVVKCKPNETEQECLDDLTSTLPEGSFKVVHKLKKSNSLAISIKSSHMADIHTKGLEAHEDPVRKPLYIPESVKVLDPHRKLQDVVPYGIDMVQAREVWDQYQTKGEGVKVCVMDTGIYKDHEDLTNTNISGYSGSEAVTPWDSDTDGHGTHVTGTIAAASNGGGVVGVAPNAEIYTVRVFGNDGVFHGSDIVAAVEACRDAGVDVINMSLGGEFSDIDEKEILEDVYYNDGILSVAAAGNSGGFNSLYPAAYEIVVSVAAVDVNENVASFSTRNSRVDIAAPGVQVWSTWNDGSYAKVDGTSQACPHVAGVAALLKSYKPDATASDLFNALVNSARNPYTVGGRDDYYGHGIVQALDAMNYLDGNTSGGGSSASPPSNTCVTIEATLTTDDYAYETVHYLEGYFDGQVYWNRSGLSNYQTYADAACVDPSGCYVFTIGDSYGDGIAGSGVELKYDGSVVFSGGSFGYGGYKYLGNGCPP